MMKKRSVSLLLAICILCYLLPPLAPAAKEATLSGYCGADAKWFFDPSVGELSVFGTGAMYDYDIKEAPWESFKDDIIKITILNGITAIGEYCFEGLSRAKSVIIPDGIITIGAHAFADCIYLKNITIPDSVRNIGYLAFDRTRDHIEGERIDGVFYMGNYLIDGRGTVGDCTVRPGTIAIAGGAFGWSKELKSVTIPHGVISVGDFAFNYCTALTEISISDSVSSIGKGAFSNSGYANDLTNWSENALYIGNHLIQINEDTKGRVVVREGTITIADNAMQSCGDVTSVMLPVSLINIGMEAFLDCYYLRQVFLQEGNPYLVNDGAGFLYNSDKTRLIFAPKTIMGRHILPDSVCTIDNGAFYECRDITGIVIPERVVSIGRRTFFRCDRLSSVVLPSNLDFIGEEAFSECEALEEILLPKGLSKIAKGVFSHSGLKSIAIPEGITRIEGSAFTSCSNLQTVSIPESVTFIGNSAFRFCSALKEIQLPPAMETISATAFFDCNSLKEVVIPKSVVLIENGAFSACDALQGIWVEEGNQYYTNDSSGVLYSKDKTVIVCCPGAYIGKYVVPQGVIKILNYTFEECSGLTEIDIPNTVTRLGVSAFADCISLKRVTIPGSIVEISLHAFYKCRNLSEAIIEEGVKIIGTEVFNYCDSLTSMTMPSSVEEIGISVFDDCNGLESIYVMNPDCKIASYSDSLGNKDITVIYGFANSTAQAYAEKYGYQFEVMIQEPEIDEPIKIRHSIELANDILLHYLVEEQQLADYESYYLECSVPVYTKNTEIGRKVIQLQPVWKNGYYYFTLDGLTAVQMSDVIEARLCMKKNGESIISDTDFYSIAQYAYGQLESTGTSEKLKRLCADLLRYGALAQKFKGYRTDAPADSGLTEGNHGYLTDLDNVTFGNCNKILEDGSVPAITWAGKSLSLESQVVVRFIIDASTYKEDVETLTLRVTYQDSQGKIVTAVMENPELFRQEKGWYSFDFAELRAAELRTVLSAAVYRENTRVSPITEYSVDTYCINKSGLLGELCKALIAYSDSAKAFFEG